MHVYIETRTVGQSFGTVGVIRHAGSRRKLAETDVRPYGFTAAAISDAEALAERKGWTVVSQEEAANKRHPKKRIKKVVLTNAEFGSGYAYRLDRKGVAKGWQKARDDCWDTVVISALGCKLLGERHIDGSLMLVGETEKGIYAQSTLHVKRS